MSYTTPTTRSTGNSISAANWNTDVVDDVRWLAGDSGGKPSCRVYNSAAIAITTATITALTFDSERWDNGSMHSTSSNTSRITVPSGGAGKYSIGGSALFASNATGVRLLAILLNGATYLAVNKVPAISGETIDMAVHTIYHLAVGDYVELRAYQTSGGNLNVSTLANSSPEFYAMWQAI